MITQDQSDVIEFLGSPSAHDGAEVERIDTHTAMVFLAGARAWKLKRAVRFDYLDASTIERRRVLCEAEVRLNRRTAPDVYRAAVPVTREAGGGLAIGGRGTPVDWVVEMNRFDQEALLDRLAAAGCLNTDLMPALGDAIARFHQAAERRPDHGGGEGILRVIEGNAAGFEEFGRGVLDGRSCRELADESRAAVAAHYELLEVRRAGGFVRQCHGDLHLRNIVLVAGRPVLFDAIEFNDDIACIDVLYDVAFLLMDLWRRHLPRHANAVWNSYLRSSGDLTGLGLMPLFLGCRAAVRAKTSVTAASFQREGARAAELQALAREYLAMASRLLHPPAPRMVAVGGLSGTGKSTLAIALAPSLGAAPGAVVLRSDEIRKELSGIPAHARLGPQGYTPEVSERVYGALTSRAKAIVRSGHSVIVDAVYARPGDRDAIERVAADAGAPFAGFWLEAPEAALMARVAVRRHDASDADAGVIRLQREQETGAIRWTRIDASPAPDLVRQSVERALDTGGPGERGAELARDHA